MGRKRVQRNGLVGTIFAVILVIALTVMLVAAWIVTKMFVIVNWQLFPRNQEVLDLREQAVSPEDFNILARMLPGTDILWSVPFQGGYLSSDVETLTLTYLREDDISALEYLPKLKTVDASGCTDYAALAALYTERPDLDVQFTFPVGEQVYAPSTETVTLTSLNENDCGILALMPKLTTLDATGCREYSLLERLQQEHPRWKVITTKSIAGKPIDPEATELEVSGAGYAELTVGLAAMPKLKTLMIHTPEADSTQLEQLQRDYPDVDIHWDVDFAGRVYPDDATEVDASHTPIKSLDAAQKLASYFPCLTKLIVDSTGIPDEDMAAYRDQVRDSYKVVWTVYFTQLCKARTDETYFMPIKQGEYYFKEEHVYPLRYCEDMVCIDIGHSTVATIDFAAYMPHLKYLILAWTQVTDITPLSNCKELIYLELDHDIVHDFTPLLGCTALEDLNINDQQWGASIEPISQMTWLKTLWVPTQSYRDKMLLQESLPDTRVVIQEYGSNTGMGWRNLQNYFDMRDYLGMEYMK